MKDYNMYRDDRVSKRAGGTILYVSKKLGQRPCKPLNDKLDGQVFESSIWCWVNPERSKKTLVGSVYRSPHSSHENNRLLLQKIDRAGDIAGENRLLIMGDFNAPKIDWKERITLEGASRFEIQLLEKTADCSLFNHVHEPTRFRGNDSSTLDLIFTKEEEDVKNVRVFQPLGKSDHGLAAGDFVCEWKSKVVARKNRAYFKGDYKAINEKIEEIN